MSYNYDSNPWDDEYSNPNQNVQQQQPTEGYTTSSGGYAPQVSGYSNPAASCAAQDSWANPSQLSYGDPASDYPQSQFDDQYQQQQLPGEEQYQEQLSSQQQLPPPPPPESLFKRFLRAHVPMCGQCMDLSSAICTPILNTLLKYFNRDLLVSKVFYFFFYSAFGSLFPLMGVYFKQLGMNPAQVGILTGVRPFIEIFSAPFWSGLAERFQKGKTLLMFSLVCWIVFTYSLAHIRPPASACIAFNDTDYVLYIPYSNNDLSNYDVSGLEESKEPSAERQNEMFMAKVPPAIAGGGDEESKDRVLAVEENQSVQGSRRRRRRQAPDEWQVREQIARPARYVYSVDSSPALPVESAGQDTSLQLDVDLENDFEDAISDVRLDKQLTTMTHEGDSNSIIDEPSERGFDENYKSEGDEDDNEFKASQGRAFWRYRREASSSQNEYESSETEALPDQDSSMRHQGGANEEEGSNDDDDDSGDNAENSGSSSSKGSRNRPGQEVEPGMRYRQTEEKESHNNEPRHESSTEVGNQQLALQANRTRKVYKQRHKTPPTHIIGMSPIPVQYAANYIKEKHSQFVTPMFSTIVYKLDDIKEVFFLLLLLICLGEFFSAPAITIADSITLQYLGEKTDLYGRQRAFGSVGWGITLLIVGVALDDSKEIRGHPCGPHEREKNYIVCFTIFSGLMLCALATATQFNFYYNQKKLNGKGASQTLVTTTTENDKIITTTACDGAVTNVDDLYASTRPREIFNTAPPVNAPAPGEGPSGKEKFEFLDRWKSAMFAQRTRELPEWVNVFRQFFKQPMHLIYLFITWFLGCGVGLVFTFLFWHLQDVGGTPTLFGICSVINHISEVLAYFSSSHFIKRFGHTRVLSVGLGCNLIRFLYVAFLSNPYYALPFELVQGITHAACFAACCSYMSHVSKPELRTSTQGVMQGLHHGIGRACGTLIGGYMINAIGSKASFCIYGLLSGCVLGGFLYVRKKALSIGDEEVKVDDNEALGGYGAPQGVPSAIPTKIAAKSNQHYDTDDQW